MGQRQISHLATQSQSIRLSEDRLSYFSYLPLNEFLEHIPSEVLTNLLNVWLWGESWELVTKFMSPGDPGPASSPRLQGPSCLKAGGPDLGGMGARGEAPSTNLEEIWRHQLLHQVALDMLRSIL